MAKLPDPNRFRVSSQVRSLSQTQARLDVGVEHIESGIKGGDYVQGRYSEAQLEAKKAELAVQIAEDLEAVIQGAERSHPARYMALGRKRHDS